jgi:hypothetical protein
MCGVGLNSNCYFCVSSPRGPRALGPHATTIFAAVQQMKKAAGWDNGAVTSTAKGSGQTSLRPPVLQQLVEVAGKVGVQALITANHLIAKGEACNGARAAKW